MQGKFLFFILFFLLLLPQINLFKLGSLYYIAIGLIFTYICGNMNGSKLNRQVALFLSILFITIIANEIPFFFKPYSRFVLLCILFIGVSHLFSNYKLTLFREKLLLNICSISTVIVLLSFISYVIGFGKSMGMGGFQGVSHHGNMLGFFSMISVLYVLNKSFEASNKKRYFCYILIAIIIIMLLLASSRNGLMSAVVGGLVLIKFKVEKNGKFISAILFLMFLFAILSPFLDVFLEGMLYKVNSSTEQNSILMSRENLWATRIEEFVRNPILGVGCFSVDTSIVTSRFYYNPYDVETGIVELGSTYLGMLSQTGIVGFISFIGLIVTSLKAGYKSVMSNINPNAKLYFAILTSILVHLIFEGYANTAGSILTLSLWLVIACNCHSNKKGITIKCSKNFIYY